MGRLIAQFEAEPVDIGTKAKAKIIFCVHEPRVFGQSLYLIKGKSAGAIDIVLDV
jgi:hypothetical protein